MILASVDRQGFSATMSEKKKSAKSLRKEFRLALFPLLLLGLCAFPIKSAARPTAGALKLRGPAEAQTIRRFPIFIFHANEFWLNLHHFLYVLGRAQNKTRDSSREAVVHAPADQEQGLARLKPKEQAIWQEAVAWYAARLSKKDLVFDDPLPQVTNSLAQADEEKLLAVDGLDPALAGVLARAAPIYRKAWWPKHHAANRAWQTAQQSLVKRHGAAILAFITHAYQMEWPAAGFDVHISAYTNWAGAYSTKGDLLVLSSLSADLQGNHGLETIFHEGMHQWDSQIFNALREQARRLGKLVPRGLSHGLIFFTAGEAVRHVVPTHERYADKFGVWERGMTREREVLEEIWKPYLDGRGTRDEAFAELITRLATEQKK